MKKIFDTICESAKRYYGEPKSVTDTEKWFNNELIGVQLYDDKVQVFFVTRPDFSIIPGGRHVVTFAGNSLFIKGVVE